MLVKDLFLNFQAKKLFNNAIGVITTNLALSRKLLESPDFVRFQFVG